MAFEDVRWIHRLKCFEQAHAQLKKAADLAQVRPLSDLEEQGVIQAFEFTHELAWNVLKDFLEEQGAGELSGSKDSTREAFRHGLIEKGYVWMGMIQNRKLTSHTYNSQIARKIVRVVLADYYPEFGRLLIKMTAKMSEASTRSMA